MSGTTHDVFIAHAGATRDTELAEALFDHLTERGRRPFLATRCVEVGQDLDLAIRDALMASGTTVMLISPSADRAFYLRPEVVAAVERHLDADDTHRVVPVWIDGVPPPEDDVYGLNALEGIPLGGATDIVAAAEQLGALISRGPGRPAGHPTPSPVSVELVTNFRLPRNPHFTGRDDLLDQLAGAGAGSHLAITQSVVGMGGVGKSELAAEYVHRRIEAGAVEIVWWVRAESEATLTADLAQLGVRLAGAPADETDRAARSAVAALEAETRPWLLVLDNALDPGFVSDWLPARGPGQTLITSRVRLWGSVGARSVRVPLLPREAAVDFVCARTGQDDRDAAARLAERLGHMALALHEAAAYIGDSGLGIGDYHALIDEYPHILTGDDADPGVRTLASTFGPSIDRLRATSPAAAEMVEVAAYLAPDRIPVALFADEAGGEVALASASRAATDAGLLGLIEPGGDATFSVHRVVQEVVRRRLGADATAVTRGLRLLEPHLPLEANDPEHWPAYELLASHVVAISEHGSERQAQDMAELLLRVGYYQLSSGSANEARDSHERAVTLLTATLGPEHPETLVGMSNLAETLWRLGDRDGARELQEELVWGLERTLGPEHIDTLAGLSNLAATLREDGDLAAARALHRRALEAMERTLGPEHPHTLSSMNNLAEVLREDGDLADARGLHEQVLDARARTLGPEHPDTLIDMNNLAELLRDERDLAAARRLHEQVLEARDRTLGAEHPETIISMNNLATTLEDLDDLAGAQSLLEEALQRAEATLGPEHPLTGQIRENLEG